MNNIYKMGQNLFQRICGRLTDHKIRRGVGYGICLPTEYYYKCKVCGCRFWNWVPYKDAPTAAEMEMIVHDYGDRHELPRGHFDYRNHPWDAPDDKVIATK